MQLIFGKLLNNDSHHNLTIILKIHKNIIHIIIVQGLGSAKNISKSEQVSKREPETLK